MLGVADGFSASAFLVFEGEVVAVTDSVVLAKVVESSAEVVVCWFRAGVELSLVEESEAEVAFAAPEAEAEPSPGAAESDRFHCRKNVWASVEPSRVA